MKNMRNKIKVSICDTEYTICFRKKLLDGSNMGLCDFVEKKIYIVDNYEVKNTIVHELMHAYMYEYGLLSYASNEELIECLTSIWFNISKKLEIIEEIIDEKSKKIEC